MKRAHIQKARSSKPRYKLVARVSTEQFKTLVLDGILRSNGWRAGYRAPGRTVSIDHPTACLALFGRGDDIFLCDLPPVMEGAQ